ncbi:MAG: mechanosensitive ion channel family protein [Acholeplasmataceae bacterium]|nr:mechanosensitive ion channel family protein [Acholeplasmataceae bacterium]
MNLMVLFASNLWNGLFTAGVIIALIVIFLFERYLMKKNEENLHRGFVVFIFVFSFVLFAFGILCILWVWEFDFVSYFNAFGIGFMATLTSNISPLVGSVVVIFVALFLLKLSKIAFRQIGKKPGPLQRRKKTIARVFRSISKYVIVIIALLIVLSIWGINVAPALAGLGILGLVIGLGAQKFINDLISGFFIVFEHHFDVGDKIEVQGFKGEVIDIGLKTTKIKNWKGEIKIMSNGEISTLINFSKDPSIAVAEFGIAYHEDIQKTIDVLTTELPKMRKDFPEIIEDPKVLGVIELANSSINMRAIAKTLNEQHYAVERAMRQHIKRILDEHGIEIPFPQVVVHQPKPNTK